MPHLIIEYSENLAGLDERDVLSAAMAALSSTGLYDMPTAKGRIFPLREHCVDAPDDGTAFVAATLKILPGRSGADRQRTSAAITEAIASVLRTGCRVQITTEVVEMEPLSYSKRVI